ncbi:hypothetical protein [Streptosporangium sp. NPDC000396]
MATAARMIALLVAQHLGTTGHEGAALMAVTLAALIPQAGD